VTVVGTRVLLVLEALFVTVPFPALILELSVLVALVNEPLLLDVAVEFELAPPNVADPV